MKRLIVMLGASIFGGLVGTGIVWFIVFVFGPGLLDSRPKCPEKCEPGFSCLYGLDPATGHIGAMDDTAMSGGR